MTLDIQFKLKSNPLYIKYLRENSSWYKTLTRNPTQFDNFINEMKANYLIRPTDRISKALQYIEILQTIMSSVK